MAVVRVEKNSNYENLKSAFEKMEEANYVWPYKV